MRFSNVRSRMLIAALLPVFVVVVALVSFFSLGRIEDVRAFHAQRGKLLLRQTVLASELGLFAGNYDSLQIVVDGVQKEPDVRLVALFDAQGALLVRSAPIAVSTYQALVRSALQPDQAESGMDTFFGPIVALKAPVDDLYMDIRSTAPAESLVLGYAVVQLSRDLLANRQREMLYLALGVTATGLVLGGLLAARLGEGVVRPILRVARMMERIGRGDFSSRVPTQPDDPMYDLETGLNRMAMRLEWGRDELEQQVREATKEISARKEEAEAATLAKTRFLAAASHDLRQPTHALGMFIARLGQLPLDATSRKLVGNLEASALAMQNLLDSLLDISRLDQGVVPVHPTNFSLQTLLDNVTGSMAPVAAAKGLVLRIRPTGLWACTDANLMQRMVMNLVHNAINYTEQGSVLLACRCTADAARVRIEVWDSGIGISPEHHGDIFKEFYQVGNRGRDRSQGLGLGLNIVERSAQLLGVRVSLKSELGCGTRFTLHAPAGQPDAPSVVSLDRFAGTDLEGIQILVVEDDVAAREAICELLSSWGCKVVSADNAPNAIAMVRAGMIPKVIVSDYRLGDGGDGLQVIAWLREMTGQDLPACLMSGDTDAALLQLALDAGLTLLHKPVRPAKLRSLLRRLATPPMV